MDKVKNLWSTGMPSRSTSLQNLIQATQQSNGAMSSQASSSQYSLFSSGQHSASTSGNDWGHLSQNPSLSSAQTQGSQRFANLLRTPGKIAQSLMRAVGSRRPLAEHEVVASLPSQPKSQKSAEESSRHVLNEILQIKCKVEKISCGTEEVKRQLSSGLCVAELRAGSVPIPEYLKSSLQKACQSSHEASVRTLSRLSDVTASLKLLAKQTEKNGEELATLQVSFGAKLGEVNMNTQKQLEKIRASLKKRQKKKRLLPYANPYSAFGYRNFFSWKPRKAAKPKSQKREVAHQKSPVITRVNVANSKGRGEKKKGDKVEKRSLPVVEESASKRGKVNNAEDDDVPAIVYESVSVATQGPVTRNWIRQQFELIDNITEQSAATVVAVSKGDEKLRSPPSLKEKPGGMNEAQLAKKGCRGRPRKSQSASAVSESFLNKGAAIKYVNDVVTNNHNLSTALGTHESHANAIDKSLFDI